MTAAFQMGKTFRTYSVSHYKQISVKQIQISPDITPPIKRHLLGSVPLIKDINAVSSDAIRAVLEQCPPIAYTTKKAENTYYCVGNFRSLVLSAQLPDHQKIVIALIDRPKKIDIDQLCLTNELINSLLMGKDIKSLPIMLLKTKELVDDRHPDAITSISPKLKTKKSFSDLLGINRRLR